VGDSVTLDSGGGRAAGLRTIWMRRGESWPRGEVPPDHQADTVADAVAILPRPADGPGTA
jgi:FMN phosphatase YigB (HAD superfamily)